MKLVDARSFVEALAGTWARPSRRKTRLESYQEPPHELRALAERSRSFGPTKFLSEPQETLE